MIEIGESRRPRSEPPGYGETLIVAPLLGRIETLVPKVCDDE
jgi:hypothetical protein